MASQESGESKPVESKEDRKAFAKQLKDDIGALVTLYAVAAKSDDVKEVTVGDVSYKLDASTLKKFLSSVKGGIDHLSSRRRTTTGRKTGPVVLQMADNFINFWRDADLGFVDPCDENSGEVQAILEGSPFYEHGIGSLPIITSLWGIYVNANDLGRVETEIRKKGGKDVEVNKSYVQPDQHMLNVFGDIFNLYAQYYPADFKFWEEKGIFPRSYLNKIMSFYIIPSPGAKPITVKEGEINPRTYGVNNLGTPDVMTEPQVEEINRVKEDKKGLVDIISELKKVTANWKSAAERCGEGEVEEGEVEEGEVEEEEE